MSEPAASNTPETSNSRMESWVVWVIWASMSLAGLWFVWNHALVVPFADEWHWVSVGGRATPVTCQWLGSQHNEHRPLFPRLAYVGLARLTGYDLRAPGMLNVVMLSMLAAVAMLSARAIRGHTSVGDAFFPLVLLNWSQFTNLLWGFQTCLVMAAVFVCAGMLAVTHASRARWLAWAAAAVACFVIATWSAAAGLACLPGLAVWLLAGAAICWHQRKPYRASLCLGTLLLTLATVVAFVAYLVGFHRPSQHFEAPGLLPQLRTGSEFLANTLGAVGRKLWPASAVVVAVGCVLSLVHLLRRAWLQPEQRIHVLGLLNVLAASMGLVAAIGWGRAFLGPGAGSEDRYVTLAIPLACLFYWQSVALAGRWSTRIQVGLMLLAALLLVPNGIKGLRGAASLHGSTDRLFNDARAGIPLDALAVRYLEGTGFGDPKDLARQLNVLWQNGFGPYRGVPRLPLRNDLTIRPLAQPPAEGLPRQTLPLGPGDSLVRPLQGSGDVNIERIDLLAARCPRWPIKRLRWEVGTPGGKVLASGVVDAAELSYTDWLTLRPESLRVRGDWRLEVRLSAEGPADARPLEIPLFGPAESLKGFLYCGKP